MAVTFALIAGAPAYCAEAKQAKPLPAPVLMKTQTGVMVEVIFAANSDLEVSKEYIDLRENSLFALMSLPAGLLMAISNPLFIAAPLVGVAVVPAGQSFKNQVETVRVALDPTTFGLEIAKAIVDNLETITVSAGLNYSFSIASYGLVARDGAPRVFESGREVCLFVVGALRFRPADGPTQEQPFALTRSGRTDGMPPPTCQPFDLFASDDGKLLRTAMTEAAYVIGAWSVQAGLRP